MGGERCNSVSAWMIRIFAIVNVLHSFAAANEGDVSLHCFFGNSYPLLMKACIEFLPTPQSLVRSRRQIESPSKVVVNINETQFGAKNHTANKTRLQTSGQLQVLSSEIATTYSCMAFVPHKTTRDTPIVYQCDEGIYCSNSASDQTTIRNVTFHRTEGDVICCRKSECNSPKAFNLVEKTLTSVTQCYSGTSSDAHIQSTLCPSMSAACFNLTSANQSEYQCDAPSESLCSAHNITTNECKQVRLSGVDTTLCCCFTDSCNLEPEKRTSDEPRPSTPYESLEKFLNLTWVGYLWSGIAVVILTLALAIIVIRKKRRRCATVSLVSDLRYQRLTANFNAGDTEDVQMLLADNDA